MWLSRGEIENGAFGSFGPGWEEFPQIEEELEPMHDYDDGVFHLTKEEFFEYFETVYLGASDMSEFLLDGMKMSKHSKHAKMAKQSGHSTTRSIDSSVESFILEEEDDEDDDFNEGKEQDWDEEDESQYSDDRSYEEGYNDASYSDGSYQDESSYD